MKEENIVYALLKNTTFFSENVDRVEKGWLSGHSGQEITTLNIRMKVFPITEHPYIEKAENGLVVTSAIDKIVVTDRGFWEVYNSSGTHYRLICANPKKY